jgi:hypothetical protein
VATDASSLDVDETIRVIEDYKALDVQSATMAMALCRGVRQRYPDWRYLIDGDGGDENLKDYPIEQNPELTIRSVINNPMLYQEGWGVGKIKHSLTYSGGLSRSYSRTYAPAHHFGFRGFSPFHATVGDRGRGGHSVYRSDQLRCGATVSAEGRYRGARGQGSYRLRYAGVSQAALPARGGFESHHAFQASVSRGGVSPEISVSVSMSGLLPSVSGRAAERDAWILSRRPARESLDPYVPL